MANKIQWDAAPVHRGAVLTSHLNSLADTAYSCTGVEYNNSSVLDQYAIAKLTVKFGTAPTAAGYVGLYLTRAVDCGNYDFVDDGNNDPRPDKLVATINVLDTVSTQTRSSGIFTIPPTCMKFVLYNGAGQSFPATGSTVDLFTFNDEIQ